MTSNEWTLVKRMVILVLVVALFPIGALVYRVFFSVDALTPAGAIASPAVYTLVPSASTPAPFPTPSLTPIVLVVPSGWNELAAPEQNLAIAVPPRWQRLPVNPEELEASLKVIRQSNPDLANALGARAPELMAGGVKLWAFDFDPSSLQSKFATNLTITRQTLVNTVSLDTYVTINLTQIEQLASRQGSVEHERVVIGNAPAERVRYNLAFQATDGSTGTSAITQYLILSGNNALVLTYSTQLEQYDKYKTVFDQSAASFRILAP